MGAPEAGDVTVTAAVPAVSARCHVPGTVCVLSSTFCSGIVTHAHRVAEALTVGGALDLGVQKAAVVDDVVTVLTLAGTLPGSHALLGIHGPGQCTSVQ